MSEVQRLGVDDILIRASAALGKVDLHGRRGVTMLSVDETEAMALLLARLGLAPTLPGKDAPTEFFPQLKDH